MEFDKINITYGEMRETIKNHHRKRKVYVYMPHIKMWWRTNRMSLLELVEKNPALRFAFIQQKMSIMFLFAMRK